VELHKPDWLVQMEGILESLDEGVIVVDDCDVFIYANQALAEMTGVAVESVLGRTRAKFYEGVDLDALKRQVELSRQHGRNRFEFFLPHADGSRVPVVVGARVIEDLDGREFTVLTFTDISEQKRAVERLREMNEQLEARQREIDNELALAQRVQQSLAPQPLRWGRFAVESYYRPVRDIGGDFGVVAPRGEAHLNLLVCDVSGHGISSALLANRIYTETLHLLERGAAPEELLRELNSFVFHQIHVPGFYFTMAAARVEPSGRVTFAGAAHPPAFWHCAAGGGCRHLDSQSTVLGLLEHAVPERAVHEITLAPGDRLVFYTDGLAEVWNRAGDLLGWEGLQQIVCRNARRPLPEMKQAILDEIEAWRHGPLADDASLILTEFL
jgi:PAS domain S-box-containing protein